MQLSDRQLSAEAVSGREKQKQRKNHREFTFQPQSYESSKYLRNGGIFEVA